MSSYEIKEVSYNGIHWKYINIPAFDNFDSSLEYIITTNSTTWSEYQNTFRDYMVYGVDPFNINTNEKQFKLLKII